MPTIPSRPRALRITTPNFNLHSLTHSLVFCLAHQDFSLGGEDASSRAPADEFTETARAGTSEAGQEGDKTATGDDDKEVRTVNPTRTLTLVLNVAVTQDSQPGPYLTCAPTKPGQETDRTVPPGTRP